MATNRTKCFFQIVGVLCCIFAVQNVCALFVGKSNIYTSLDNLDEFLERNSNITSLLDENIGKVHKPKFSLATAQDRSDIFPDFEYQSSRSFFKPTSYSFKLVPAPVSYTKYHRQQITTTGVDINLPKSLSGRLRSSTGQQAIFPGTHWCGYGTAMNKQRDLGVFRMTDLCCKIHDMCPYFIKPGQKRYRLINNGLYTRSHCDCDRDFYRCLKRANSIVSNKIGFTYFNILGPQCFKEAPPIKGCKKSFNNRCLNYAYDRSFLGNLIQWFDNPFY